MKFIWITVLTLALLVDILCNARPTEETPSSPDPESSETPAEGDQSSESPEQSSPSDAGEGQSSEEPTEDGSPKPNEKPSEEAPPEKGSPAATYEEVGKILDAVDFKSIEDLYLQRMLENEYQARVRNPIRAQTGSLADFSAIKECFGKLAGEVKKLIDAAKKQFETCKAGDEESARCSDEQQNGFADGLISLTTTLQGCIVSNQKN